MSNYPDNFSSFLFDLRWGDNEDEVSEEALEELEGADEENE